MIIDRDSLQRLGLRHLEISQVEITVGRVKDTSRHLRQRRSEESKIYSHKYLRHLMRGRSDEVGDITANDKRHYPSGFDSLLF